MKPRGFQYMADVSSNNGEINIPAYSRAGHVIIAIKATQGDHYTNPYHKKQCDEAHEFGLTVLHYHFNEEVGPSQEVAHFRSVYQKSWRNGDYTGFDFESGQSSNYVQRTIDDYYIHTLRQPSLYCDESDYWDKYSVVKIPGNRKWIANYSHQPPFKKWSWQYTDGKIGPQPHHYAGIGDSDGSVIALGPATALALRKIRTRRRK